MVANVKFTNVDANGQNNPNVNRITTPMRAVLKQVPSLEATYDEETDTTTIITVPGLEIEFPYGPVDVKYASIALRYSQIARPGLKPLLVRSSPKLNVVTFTALIADKQSGGKVSVEDTLDILKRWLLKIQTVSSFMAWRRCRIVLELHRWILTLVIETLKVS